MKNTVAVHMLNRFHQLVDVVFNARLGHVISSALDRVIQIHVHQLKYERQSACRLIE